MYGKLEVEDRYTHENQMTEGGEIMAEKFIISGNGSCWRQAIYQCELHYFFSVIITLVVWDEIILLPIIWFEYHAIIKMSSIQCLNESVDTDAGEYFLRSLFLIVKYGFICFAEYTNEYDSCDL